MRRCWCERSLPEKRAIKKTQPTVLCFDSITRCISSLQSYCCSSIPDRKNGSRLFDVERMQMKEEWRNNQKRWAGGEEKWVSGNTRGKFLFSVYVCVRWKKTCIWGVESVAARSDEYGCEASLCREKPAGKYKLKRKSRKKAGLLIFVSFNKTGADRDACWFSLYSCKTLFKMALIIIYLRKK